VSRSAVLLGASGLVGGLLLGELIGEPAYASVTLLTRRALGLELAAGKVREKVVDFDRPETFRDAVNVDDVFCCLGTTIKKAGSQAAFRKVDLDAPLAVAREARAAGAGRYLIVTAVGADAKSSVFYNRVKGEAEEALAQVGFPRGLRVVRPSLILGERAERRPAERAAMAVMGATRGLFVGPLTKYRAIDAAAIARAMLRAALQDGGGPVEVYEGERLFALA
jgi:uncharacterized protein YbjT (DUF2867 family)